MAITQSCLASPHGRRATTVTRLVLVAVVAGVSLFVRSAPAGIIIQDQFDYPTGSLNGKNGGQGFSAAWQATGALQVTNPGLTYGELETSGNAITGLSSGPMKRLFDNTGLTGDGATYWFSVLFAAPEATAKTATSIPSFFSDATRGTGQVSGFAVSWDPRTRTSLYMDARIGGSTLATKFIPGTDYYTGSYLVLGQITFSDTAGLDRLKVWLDPPLTGSPGTPLFNVTGTWVDPGANNSFYMYTYNDPDRSVDEIRLGTTLADVVPVPEPSSVALLAVGLGCGSYGFIRRKSTRSPSAVWSNRAR